MDFILRNDKSKDSEREKKYKILVIDDELRIREGFQMALPAGKFIVDTAPDGETGVEKAKKGQYDIIFTDLKMPGMDGVAVLREIMAILPEAHVVIITGYSSVDTAVTTFKEGALDYIVKPFTSEELLAKIDSLIKKIQ